MLSYPLRLPLPLHPLSTAKKKMTTTAKKHVSGKRACRFACRIRMSSRWRWSRNTRHHRRGPRHVGSFFLPLFLFLLWFPMRKAGPSPSSGSSRATPAASAGPAPSRWCDRPGPRTTPSAGGTRARARHPLLWMPSLTDSGFWQQAHRRERGSPGHAAGCPSGRGPRGR